MDSAKTITIVHLKIKIHCLFFHTSSTKQWQLHIIWDSLESVKNEN